MRSFWQNHFVKFKVLFFLDLVLTVFAVRASLFIFGLIFFFAMKNNTGAYRWLTKISEHN